MKRKWLIAIASLAMVVTLAFGFAACQPEENGGPSDEEIAQSGITTLNGIYLDGEGKVRDYETPDDYSVVSRVKVEDEFYAVSWSVSSDTENIAQYVSIATEADSSSQYTIDITPATFDIEYKLTASITVGKVTKTTSYSYKIPKKSSEEATTASISFATSENRTEFTGDIQVWENKDGTLVFTNRKANSTSDVGDYSSPVRIYQGSTVEIEFPGLTTVVFHSASNDPETYKNPKPFYDYLKADLETAFPNDTVTADDENSTLTLTLKTPVDFIEFTASKQLRLNSIDVEGTEGGASAQQKVASVKAWLTVTQSFNKLTTVELITEKAGTTISWAIKGTSEYAKVEGGNLVITKLPEEGEQQVTLVATISAGAEAQDTREFTLTLTPEVKLENDGSAEHPYTVADVFKLANALATGDVYKENGQTVSMHVKGIVTNEGTWAKDFSNWQDVLIADTASGSQTLKLYGLNPGAGLSETNGPKVGGTITVVGALKNYKGEIELTFDGSVKLNTVAYTAPVDERTPQEKVTAALAALANTFTVTGTGETDLPASTVDGVTFAWSTTDQTYPIANNKISVTALPAEDATVTATVTATCGTEAVTNNTKTVTITIRAQSSQPEPSEGDGSKDSPFTVSQALDIIKGLASYAYYTAGGSNPVSVYVQGIVTVKGTSDEYGIKNYYIADAAGDTDNDVLVFSLNWSTAVPAGTAIELGDTILIQAYLQNYNGEYEITYWREGTAKPYTYHNGYVEGHTPVGGEEPEPQPPVDDGDYGTEAAPLSVKQALALAEKECVNNNDWTAKPVYVIGKVKNVPGVSGTAYTNIYLVDGSDPKKEILVFKVVLKPDVPAPAQNDTLVISGYITRFSFDTGTDGKIEFSDKDGTAVTALSNTRGHSNITLGAHSGATVSGLPERDATNGTTVTFTVTAEEGKEIVAVKLNGAKLTATQENSYSFTVAGDAEITIETKVEGAPDASVLATFTFGADGTAGHNDGKTASSYNETDGNYTLTLTGCATVYSGAYDAKGKSCIKLGTSKNAASFTFTVPTDITKVVIYVAGYKANDGEITVNGGTAQSITTHSNDGAYTAVEVDTTTVKNITFATTSTVCRAMIDKIEFWGIASVGPEPTPGDVTTVTFDASTLSYETNHNLTTENAGDVTIAFSNGTNNNNPPIFHADSKVLRIYFGNTFTVTAPSGNVITKITFTFGADDKANEIASDKGTFESPVWTGSASAVTFSIEGTSGHRRIAKLVIEYKESTEPEHVHAYKYSYDETTGWQHKGHCDVPGCDRPEITEECAPVANRCEVCEHTYTETEILEKLFALTGSNTVNMKGTYSLTGKVLRINTPYDDAKKNVTFTIKVNGREIQCYREKSEHSASVKPGDTVTVVGGLMHYYNGTKEFGENCEITSLTSGELTDAEKVSETLLALTLPASATTDLTLPTSPFESVQLTWKSDNGSFAIDGNTLKIVPQSEEVTLKITVTAKSGEAENSKEFIVVVPAKLPDGAVTATVSIAEYATAHDWKNQGAEVYSSVTVDENIEATIVGTGNTGKYYTDWRIYQTGGGGITITAKNGYTLYSVKVTYSTSNGGVLMNEDAQVVSNVAVRVEGTSVTLMVGNTGSANNGQARITAIEVIYVPASPAAAAEIALLPGKND